MTTTAAAAEAENGQAPTAAKVVQSAIDCILSQGFYRASTNAIAREAGVTWGVIQHHFGTREKLMLAVVEHAVQQMDEQFGQVVIEGATLEERVEQMADLIFSFYRNPNFLAYTQVVMNLGQDPRTANKTLKALTDVSARMGSHLPRLRDQVLGDHSHLDDEFRFAFETLRGVAVNQQVLRALPNRAADSFAMQDDHRRRLVGLVTGYLADCIAADKAA